MLSHLPSTASFSFADLIIQESGLVSNSYMKHLSVHALLLAAGYGTRLKP